MDGEHLRIGSKQWEEARNRNCTTGMAEQECQDNLNAVRSFHVMKVSLNILFSAWSLKSDDSQKRDI